MLRICTAACPSELRKLKEFAVARCLPSRTLAAARAGRKPGAGKAVRTHEIVPSAADRKVPRLFHSTGKGARNLARTSPKSNESSLPRSKEEVTWPSGCVLVSQLWLVDANVFLVRVRIELVEPATARIPCNHSTFVFPIVVCCPTMVLPAERGVCLVFFWSPLAAKAIFTLAASLASFIAIVSW